MTKKIRAKLNSLIVKLGEDMIGLAMVIACHNSTKLPISTSDWEDAMRFHLVSTRGYARKHLADIKEVLTNGSIDIDKHRDFVRTSSLILKPEYHVSSKIIQTVSRTRVSVKERVILCQCDICQEMLIIRAIWTDWKPTKEWEKYFVSLFSYE